MRKNTMHLFAGGGGGILGDLILGHTPIVAVEWDKYACKVLRERVQDGWFEGMHVYEGDVRLFDPSEYTGRVDCIHAGFPCQDISVAGKQAGVGEDTRSGLYREVLRIADVVRPGELFMENVSAILSNGLGVVLADLSARGYSARWMCLRASDVGANHHRDRWWLLARKAMANTTGERVRGRERDFHQTDGRQNGKLCEQFIRAGSESENMAKSSRRSDVLPLAEYIGIGWREQFAQGVGKATREIPNSGSSRFHQRGGFNTTCESVRQLRGNECDGIPSSAQEEIGDMGKDISDTDTERLQRLNGSAKRYRPPSPQRFAGQCRGNIGRQPKPAICGVDDVLAFGMDANWYAEEPNVGRVTSVNKDRASQLKALGNGQVPLQMAVAYSILEELFNA